jgi:tetratricopeptide (TPR) repeat protein
MRNNLWLIIAGIAVFSVIVIFSIYFSREFISEKKQKKKAAPEKNRNKILKTANKKLAQNPKDPEALLALADLNFRDEEFEKAFASYSILLDLCPMYPDLNEFEINLNYGLSALKLKNFDEAYKSLVIARNLNPNDFQANFNLGHIEYLKKNFEKACILLSHAKDVQPDHVQTIRLLGHCLFKLKRNKEAVAFLEKAVEYEPDDKDTLFALGQCYYELGINEKAFIIFTHLRTDSKLGPNAALIAGLINLGQKQIGRAIMDFEIGLRHENIQKEILLELKYRLSQAYFKEKQVDKALKLIREIDMVQPGYKDITEQIPRYQELANNKNLQTYLISSDSEFLTLCRKITTNYFPQARTKIVSINMVKSQYTDILAEIDTKKWQDLVLFRFIRYGGTVGELILRELYARIKDLKAGKGFCIHAGSFSENAKQFVEARNMDLIEKDRLIKLFDRM